MFVLGVAAALLGCPPGPTFIVQQYAGPVRRSEEIAILRVGHLCRSGYEFHQHTRVGKTAGLSDAEIERIKQGPEAEGWTSLERAILQAVDELHRDAFISDATWKALAAHYDEKQLIDLVFTVGQYTMVSMALNTLGVQIEDQS